MHVDGMGCNITHAYMSSNVCDLLLSEHGQTGHWASNCAQMHLGAYQDWPNIHQSCIAYIRETADCSL